MHYRFFMAAFAVLAASNAAAAATYSWSGRLIPSGGIDIWDVGVGGLPYDLSLSVDENAADRLPSIPFAAFEVTNATLTVDGEALPLLSDGLVDFTDTEVGVFDAIVFSGMFERLGSSTRIAAAVSLELPTFSFDAGSEKAPVFGSALVGSESTIKGDFYFSIVESGTAVTAIPEPSAVLSAIGLVSLLSCQVALRR